MTRAAVAVGLLVTLAACSGSESPEWRALGATEVEPGRIELQIDCSGAPVGVAVAEEAGSVVIEVTGSRTPADCAEGVDIALDAPLGGRALVVNGETWGFVVGYCPWGLLGPDSIGDLTEGVCEPVDDG